MRHMKRRELTEEEKLEAARLANAWGAYKRDHAGATQTWLGAEAGIGSQGAVGQYLRGVIPLNLKALVGICRALGVAPRSISSRLSNLVGVVSDDRSEWMGESAGVGRADSFRLTCETASEMRNLAVYRLADERGRLEIDEVIEIVAKRIKGGG